MPDRPGHVAPRARLQPTVVRQRRAVQPRAVAPRTLSPTVATQRRALQPRAVAPRTLSPTVVKRTILSNPFDEAFAENQGRDKRYSQWSERAVVVGFNRSIQAYDIMITTEQRTGNDKRSLNRTIRQVKSLAGDAQQFSPGDSVLVGYVADQREHPIILGQGDNFVQTPLKTILPAGTSPSLSEGEGPLSDGQPFQSACEFKLEDVTTGSTTLLTLDAEQVEIDGCFTSILQAKCGCGGMSWSTSGILGPDDQEGFPTVLDLIERFGPNDTFIKVCIPTNTGSNIGGNAYFRSGGGWGCTGQGGSCAAARINWKCDNHAFGCNDQRISSSDFFTICHQCNPQCCGAGCTENRDGAPASFITCSIVGNCVLDLSLACPPNPQPCADLGTSINQALDAGEGDTVDVRTDSMRNGGCFPTGLAGNILITGQDQCGNVITLEVNVINQ